LNSYGFQKLEISELFSQNVEHQFRSLTARLNKSDYDSNGNITLRDWIAEDELIFSVPNSNYLIEMVKQYLGESARLDDVCYWSKKRSNDDFSDFSHYWHTDNVGKRLKLFVCISAEENCPRTDIVKGAVGYA
jgi:hypothetical protein